MSRSASPAWVVARGQSRTVTEPPETAASARNGAALERSGSMTWSTALTGPGATRQRFASGVVDLDAVLAQHRDGHVDVGERRAPACRRGGRRRRASYRAPASSSAEMNCDDADRVDDDGAAAAPSPTPCTVNGRASPAIDDAEVAQRAEDLADRALAHVRVAVEGHGAASTARRPAARTASRCRPGRSRRRRRRSNGPGVTTQSSPEVSTVEPSDGQRRGHQRGVARAQRPAYDGGAVGDRRQHQRPVGERLAARAARRRRRRGASRARARARGRGRLVTRDSLVGGWSVS